MLLRTTTEGALFGPTSGRFDTGALAGLALLLPALLTPLLLPLRDPLRFLAATGSASCTVSDAT